jgi:IS30 family transposase
MPVHRWADPVRQKQITELSAQGLSAREIAAAIGEDPQAVAAAMSRYGLQARRGSGRKPHSTKRISLAKVKWVNEE